MFVQKTKVLQISFIAILSSFVVEIVFGLVSNSLALITDSIHALLDGAVTLILLLSVRLALKPPDKEHTYGHGKIETLGGLFGGIAIFLIAGFFIFESISRLQSSTDTISFGFFPIIGGLYVIGVDIFRIIILKRSIKNIGGVTLRADFYHAFMDLGSTLVAIVGILLVSYGINSGDFVAALILGIVLMILSLKLIYRTSLELTDTISPELVKKVRDIVNETNNVTDVGQILVRKSGDEVFTDVTISLRGDTSFDIAHGISSDVERNIKEKIPNSSAIVHFEPDWKNVSIDSKIYDIAHGMEGVKGIHNISSYKSEGKTYVTLHLMVEQQISLNEAHKISEKVEQKIQSDIQNIEHITVHLEPFVAIPKKTPHSDKNVEEAVKNMLSEYLEIQKIGRIVTLDFKDVTKIDVDCSFEKELSIEKVHDIISDIEKKIHSRYRNSIITIHSEPI